uniref:Thioredoxin n=1 Tax=Candidatus Kentrum sp. UNK TaxID=2126344 RepID=A0A451B0A3_9GAMM|nr:MAG: Thioredoxin [Candidatus Kentron sp. UNK]VFK71706.1 MAG: Thioredoxin [Candidatus Kentron sp. UNK]
MRGAYPPYAGCARNDKNKSTGIFGSGYTELVRYLENLRQNDQEILNKGGWGPAKRAPSDRTLSAGGSLRSTPATHAFGNLFGSGYTELGKRIDMKRYNEQGNKQGNKRLRNIELRNILFISRVSSQMRRVLPMPGSCLVDARRSFARVFGGMAFLSLLAACLITLSPREALAANRALFQLNGLDYLESELPPDLRSTLHQLENEYYELEDQYHRKLQQLIFDAVLFDNYLEEEAERLGKSKQEIKAERLSTPAPSEESVRAFYATVEKRIGKPYEDVRKDLADLLRAREIEKERSALLATYREKNDFKVLLPRITSPVIKIHTEGFPAKGDPKAPVTIVEFADYQCPHCKTAAEAIKAIFDDFKDKVRVVHMDYPINRSGISTLVARGAACADAQGKFWPYHELAYQRQETLSKGSSIDLAKDTELDLKEFTGCFQSEEAREKVARARAEALRLGLRSTPSIFVNGKRLFIMEDFKKDLRAAVEKELASANAR